MTGGSFSSQAAIVPEAFYVALIRKKRGAKTAKAGPLSQKRQSLANSTFFQKQYQNQKQEPKRGSYARAAR